MTMTVGFTDMTRQQFQAHLDERSVNTRDAALVARWFSESGVQRRVASGETARGRAEIRDAMARSFQAFPDWHLEVLDLFCTDNRMCVQCRLTGTNDGELLGMPPTHRRIEVELCMIFRTGPDGLVEEEVAYWDNATVLGQLGLLGS